MNIRFYVVFHLRQKLLNITHTKEMRIKADHIIIIKIVIAFKIATTYIKHLLYIRCVLLYFTLYFTSFTYFTYFTSLLYFFRYFTQTSE